MDNIQELSIIEQSFVAHITDIDNPKTHNNSTNSYLACRPAASRATAGVQGCRMLKRPKVKRAIQQIMRDAGCSIEDRVRTLADIHSGKATRKTVISRPAKDADGNQTGEMVVDSVIETEPTFSERSKAIDIINKMDGHYARVQAGKEIAVSRELTALKRRLLKRLRGETGQDNCAGGTDRGEGDCGAPYAREESHPQNADTNYTSGVDE